MKRSAIDYTVICPQELSEATKNLSLATIGTRFEREHRRIQTTPLLANKWHIWTTHGPSANERNTGGRVAYWRTSGALTGDGQN
jgi:hypothetical protein